MSFRNFARRIWRLRRASAKQRAWHAIREATRIAKNARRAKMRQRHKTIGRARGVKYYMGHSGRTHIIKYKSPSYPSSGTKRKGTHNHYHYSHPQKYAKWY